jgi:hypothetical protein
MQPKPTQSLLLVTSEPSPDLVPLARELFSVVQDGSTAILVFVAVAGWVLRGMAVRYVDSAVKLNGEVIELARSAKTWFDATSREHEDQEELLRDIKTIVESLQRGLQRP